VINFKIEDFGFEKGGRIEMKVTDFQMFGAENREKLNFKSHSKSVGFLIQKKDIVNAGTGECTNNDLILDLPNQIKILLNATNNGDVTYFEYEIKEGNEGFYEISFVNCYKGYVSFTLFLTQFNVDESGSRNYLSIGNSPLPLIYSLFAGLHAILFFCLGIYYCTKRNECKQTPPLNVFPNAFEIFVVVIQSN